MNREFNSLVPSASEKRLTKLQILVTPSELEAIDNWRFENRADNRSSAIRELIALGLAQCEGDPSATADLLKSLREN